MFSGYIIKGYWIKPMAIKAKTDGFEDLPKTETDR